MCEIFKKINTPFPFWDFTYILQLEEYITPRYFNSALPRFLKRGFEKRGKLVVTTRAQIVLVTSVVLAVIIPQLLPLSSFGVFVFTYILSALLIPVWVGLANLITTPFIELMRKGVHKKARERLSQQKKLTIIAITGSFGKTSTKYLLYKLIQHTHKTQVIEGNQNTATGVAQWILGKKLRDDTTHLIVEMGAYKVGEIKTLCEIAPPDIAAITAIAPQHLDRFGSLAKIAHGKHEIFANSKTDALRVCSEDAAKELRINSLDEPTYTVTESSMKPQYRGKEMDLSNIPAVKEHPELLSNVSIALAIAEHLGVPHDFALDTLQKYKPHDRRKDIKKMFGFTVVDDSYNLNPVTASIALTWVSKYQKENGFERLVVITGGISEQGPKTVMANRTYGSQIAEHADKAILLDSIYRPYMEQGMDTDTTVTVRPNMDAAWKDLQENDDKEKTLVLFHPERNDLAYL